MNPGTDFDDLHATLQALRQHGVVPAVHGALVASRDAFTRQLADAILAEVEAYRASGNPDVVPELESHLGTLVDAACDFLGGPSSPELGFVAEHARVRAAQKFPLDATLLAYRAVHRHLVRWVREAALEAADANAQVRRVVAAVSDFALEFTGALGTIVTSEYVAHTRVLSEAEGDRRTRLLDTLLSGYDESDRVAARLLRRAGYLEQRQSYCVAVARSVDPREMENPARAQRMADAVAEVLAHSSLRSLIGIRDNLVVAILSGTRRLSGWTAPQSLLAERAYPLLRQIGPAALIGLSNDVPSTSHVPRAAGEARLALDFAHVAERVIPYASIPFAKVLVAEARERVRTALPAWVEALRVADRKARGTLSETLRAYAEADMNVLRCAKALGRHPNTIYARMKRIEEITGLDPQRYHALTEMLLVDEATSGT